MDRKAIARQTLDIMKKGYYEIEGTRVEIGKLQKASIQGSFLLTPEQGKIQLESYAKPFENPSVSLSLERIRIWNCSTVEAILKLAKEGKEVAVLNFASAKNPGGGFLNGAKAQEESLAASSCLYKTLTAHETYYNQNRLCESMMYTNHAIYSPNVVFFRDERFALLKEPVLASVLTIPAVNMGQVLLKKEDEKQAKQVMKERMKLILAIFAQQECKHLILGAYGCGVFRNDPKQVAIWWKELLEMFFPEQFETIVFAILDRSTEQSCIRVFQDTFLDQ